MTAKTSRFDPNAVRTLALAFDRAWSLLTTADDSSLTDKPHARRYALARRIVEKADEGMLDPGMLANDAFHYVQGTLSSASA